MKLIISITTVMLLFVVGGGAFDGFEMDDNEMYNCYYVIVCDLRKPYEFRRLITAAGPELLENAFEWFREISQIPEAEDTTAFWDSYPDKKCNHTEAVKRDMFNQWIQRIGEFWSRVCEEGNQLECEKMEDAADELVKIYTEYTLSGDCQSASSMANKGAEVMKNGPAQMGGGAMKPPGFGK